MLPDAVQLLKRLEPPVRPVNSAGSNAVDKSAAQPLEKQSFDQLLSLVSTGQISSGRNIHCACEVNPALHEAQLERLSAAADRAESAGARQAIMFIDGLGLIMDVSGRSITTQLGSKQDLITTQIDAAVFVANEDETNESILSFPNMGVLPPAIALQLEAAAMRELPSE